MKKILTIISMMILAGCSTIDMPGIKASGSGGVWAAVEIQAAQVEIEKLKLQQALAIAQAESDARSDQAILENARKGGEREQGSAQMYFALKAKIYNNQNNQVTGIQRQPNQQPQEGWQEVASAILPLANLGVQSYAIKKNHNAQIASLQYNYLTNGLSYNTINSIATQGINAAGKDPVIVTPEIVRPEIITK